MEIIDGKKVSEQIKTEIIEEVKKFVATHDRHPHLAAILVGDDGASQSYIASKERSCHQVGFTSSIYRYSEDITEAKLLEAIDFINKDDEIDGLIVQLPLPKTINVNKVLEAINPAKDVDGFHPSNVGKLMLNLPTYIPATPMGIIKLLEYYKIETEGKKCVVLGRSNLVGSPISILMSRNGNPGNSTVTLCHSKTKNMEAICAEADILIVAIGKPEFIKADMVKKGAVVIDVGIHRIDDINCAKGYKIVGDVKYEEVLGKCSYITPVPGGVGLLTVACLLLNTLKAAKKEIFN